MNRSRLLHSLALLALPLVVAWFDLALGWAVLLVILLLAWRQLITMGELLSPPKGPDLVLETIIQSHFAEKARWCMDRLGVDYQERPVGGLIGVFFTGRTVPMLRIRTGRTQSKLCESSHVLRYLYGRFAGEAGVDAAFLEPTPERLEWEERLGQYGVDQQVWIYFHALKDPAFCKRAWGSHSPTLPAWQRLLVRFMYPFFEILIRRGFNPTKENYDKAVGRTEALFTEIEAMLSDGRQALLGGESTDFVDISLAALSILWLQPEPFTGGRFPEERIDPASFPMGMRDDGLRWRERFPMMTAHIERLYAEERVRSG